MELIYHYALVRIGVATVQEALDLWRDVPASEQAATSARWLAEAIQMVMLYRSWSRDLAIAYYRLARALRTGSTIADPRKPEPEYVSLEMLRDEFTGLVDEIEAEMPPASGPESAAPGPAEVAEGDSPDAPSQAVTDDQNEPTQEPPSYEDEDYEDDDEILVEEIAELEDLIERQEREAEEEAAIILDQLGIENMMKKLEQVREDEAVATADAAREEAHRQAGARQAAAAERIAMQAARSLVFDLSEYDGRVLGWARYSQTGTPCAFCAMLLSRGAVYRSQASAEQSAEGGLFHINCHCVAVPLFSREQFEGSDLFALNREYSRLWQKGDKANGLPSNPSLSVWRSYFRRMQKQRRAQEARAPQTTQEVEAA